MATDINNNEISTESTGIPNPDKPWSLEDFEFAYELGGGRFGKVYLAREIRTAFKLICAVKAISKKTAIKYESEKNIKDEVEILSKLKHPNIIEIYTWFHDEDKIYLILELAKTCLHQIISSIETILPERAAVIARQVANALSYLHTKRIVHRDLKPENILINHENVVKLADFGWAKLLDEKDVDGELNHSVAGTPDYLAPEMLLNCGYNEKVDTWCLGVLCFEMLTKKTPFQIEYTSKKKNSQNTLEKEMYHKIIKGVYTYPVQVNEKAKDLIDKLLVSDPKKRLSAAEVLKHEWIASAKAA